MNDLSKAKLKTPDEERSGPDEGAQQSAHEIGEIFAGWPVVYLLPANDKEK